MSSARTAGGARPGSPGQAPRRILIVRLSSLGDVIQTLPLPTVIRRSFPDAKIGWAIDTELAEAIEDQPDIDWIHRCDRNRWGAEAFDPRSWRRIGTAMRRLAGEIRDVQYDVSIDAQGLFKSAVIPYAARIPRRVGFAHLRELCSIFYTEKLISHREYFRTDRHHLAHMMELVRTIGCDADACEPVLPAPHSASVARIRAMLARMDATAPLVAIAPFTRWESKRWPIQRWLSLARRILNETDANLVLLGAKSDRREASEAMDAMGEDGAGRIVNLTGETSIRDMYALFSTASVTVAADTAPLHVAAAAGCPCTIGLFGATSPARTGPLGAGAMAAVEASPRLACQPCLERNCRFGTNECMHGISVDEVFRRIAEGLARINLESRPRSFAGQ